MQTYFAQNFSRIYMEQFVLPNLGPNLYPKTNHLTFFSQPTLTHKLPDQLWQKEIKMSLSHSLRKFRKV